MPTTSKWSADGLRARLMRELPDDPRLRDAVWKYCEEEEWIRECREARTTEERREAWATLKAGAKRHAKGLLDFASGRALPPRGGRREVRVSRDDYESARVAAFTAWLARYASGHPRVERFRKDVLAGYPDLLPPGLARVVLASKALRYLPIDMLKRFEVPVVGHDVDDEYSRLLEGNDPAIALVRVRRPADGAYARYEWPEPTVRTWGDAGDAELVSWDAEFDLWDTGKALELEVPRDVLTTDEIYRFRNSAGPVTVRIFRRSVLHRLKIAARALSEVTPWSEEDAVWFVLTGRAPEPDPVAVAVEWVRYPDFWRQRITISVEPWVAADRVGEVYRQARQELLGAPNDPHPAKPRSLRVFTFVEEQSGKSDRRLNRRELWKSWDWTFPHDAFAGEKNAYQNFLRAYEFGRSALFPRAEEKALARLDADGLTPVDPSN